MPQITKLGNEFPPHHKAPLSRIPWKKTVRKPLRGLPMAAHARTHGHEGFVLRPAEAGKRELPSRQGENLPEITDRPPKQLQTGLWKESAR